MENTCSYVCCNIIAISCYHKRLCLCLKYLYLYLLKVDSKELFYYLRLFSLSVVLFLFNDNPISI